MLIVPDIKGIILTFVLAGMGTVVTHHLLCAKPNKQHDGNCDGLIRPSCESRTKKYTKFKNKTNKTKYNKQASKQ